MTDLQIGLIVAGCGLGYLVVASVVWGLLEDKLDENSTTTSAFFWPFFVMGFLFIYLPYTKAKEWKTKRQKLGR